MNLFVRVFLGSAVIAAIVVGAARALIEDPADKAAKTLLDERIETARQIRRALATPIPPPERLPPITAKPAHPPKAHQGGDDAPEPRLSRRARDAMARQERRSFYSYRPYDRTGTGGW